MLRRVLHSIQQAVVSKSIRMTEAISSMMPTEPDSGSTTPSAGMKDVSDVKASTDTKPDKRHAEDSLQESPQKKLKSDQTVGAEGGRKDVFRRKKMILFLVYSGKGYLGMQRNPGARTIESDLMTALLKANMITEENHANPTKMYFQRAARTDKGVSAAGQLCSSMINVEDPVQKINQHLVDQIRVIALQRVTKKFDSKNGANARTYMYMLPTYAFTPCQQFILADYRISEETLEKVNETLKLFRGTRNFHNFTSGKKPDDPSAKRYIMEFQIGKPFVRKGMEFAVITVKGQSFMLHQIRKMIGLTIAIVQGLTGPEAVARAYGKEKCDVPKAPALGLMLDKVHYDFYNKKYGSDGMHEPILWEKYTTEIEKFKEDHIYPTMIDTEIEEKPMLQWLGTLHMHHFDVLDDPSVGLRTPLWNARELVKATAQPSETESTKADTTKMISSDDKEVVSVNDSSHSTTDKLLNPDQNTQQNSQENGCTRAACDTSNEMSCSGTGDVTTDVIVQESSTTKCTDSVVQSTDSLGQSSVKQSSVSTIMKSEESVS